MDVVAVGEPNPPCVVCREPLIANYWLQVWAHLSPPIEDHWGSPIVVGDRPVGERCFCPDGVTALAHDPGCPVNLVHFASQWG